MTDLKHVVCSFNIAKLLLERSKRKPACASPVGTLKDIQISFVMGLHPMPRARYDRN